MVDLVASVIVIDPDGFYQLSQSSSVFQVDLWEGDSGADFSRDKAHPSLSFPLVNELEQFTAKYRQEDS